MEVACGGSFSPSLIFWTEYVFSDAQLTIIMHHSLIQYTSHIPRLAEHNSWRHYRIGGATSFVSGLALADDILYVECAISKENK